MTETHVSNEVEDEEKNLSSECTSAIEADRDNYDKETGAKEVITHANPDILDEEVTS